MTNCKRETKKCPVGGLASCASCPLKGNSMTEKPKFSPYLKYPIVDEKDLELALSKAYEQGKLDPIKLVEKIISEMDKEEYWESVLLEDGEDRRLFDSYHFESWLKSQIKTENPDKDVPGFCDGKNMD